MGDEATDINGRRILRVCIRYLDNSETLERFLGSEILPDTSAPTLKLTMLKILQKYELNLENVEQFLLMVRQILME